MSTAEFVLISDARVRAVPLIDNGEPLTSLREAGPRVRVDESRSFASASALDAQGLGAGAGARRVLLGQALRGQGFVNYPSEWWHWSWGDRYWAFVQGAATAVYGAAAALTVPSIDPFPPP
jgi:hypothetical protein